MQFHAAVSALTRRIQNMVHFCTLSTPVRFGSGAPTAQMRPDDMRTFDGVVMIQHFGLASSAPVGSVVVRISGNGDASNGVCIGTLHHASLPTITTGQSAVYDQIGSIILLDNQGNITITPHGGKVKIVGDLDVSGNIAWATATNPTHASSHTHSGVQPGTSSTQAPTPGS